MRRILLMLTLLLSVVVRTTAGPVTADAALKKAKAFMAARNAGKSEGLALAKDKNLWMSETDGGDTLGKNTGEMGAGLWLANRRD